MSGACPTCSFDPATYTSRRDRERTLAAAPIRWRWMADAPAGGAPPELAALRERFDLACAGTDDLEALHGTEHALHELGRARHDHGIGAPAAEGAVAGLFTSAGGVPKEPVAEVRIDRRGVVGDRQANRIHHGKPIQALCLWSADVVDRLRAEGHPVQPGRAGENVSVRGIDWAALQVGTLLALGDEVLVEVTAYATPCKKNAAWFLDGDFGRMGHDREPGVSRLYAAVHRGGTLRAGDAVVVEPEPR